MRTSETKLGLFANSDRASMSFPSISLKSSGRESSSRARKSTSAFGKVVKREPIVGHEFKKILEKCQSLQAKQSSKVHFSSTLKISKKKRLIPIAV